MQRIYVPSEEIAKKQGIRLSEEKARYLLSVLRTVKGDRLILIDGKGKGYEAEVSA
ncbi:MAG: 16S rRNA (uracil(1498)-N(3))-methyltransferase, partial [Nitrospirales bacterium]|nr:16S rRNA (uracil(1498)-N(3))-methyltransferase [Nitrospirales bacterium]